MIDNATARVRYADQGDLSRPVDAEWVRAAQDQRVIVLTCGMDPWTGSGLDELDCYLARVNRLFMGLLTMQGVRSR